MDFPERYLGDGVYASFDGFHVWLDLRGQDPNRLHRIALDPSVMINLFRYKEDINALVTARLIKLEGGEDNDLSGMQSHDDEDQAPREI